MNQKKIIFLVGPTAVGKTAVAFLLAQQINGEIVSCDSMQVYKEISIASSKPDAEMLGKVPHHLVGIISVDEEFDVASFNKLVLSSIQQIHKENKIPVVVGGSGLYVQILLDGIFEGGGKDSVQRDKLIMRAQEEGNEALYAELEQVDPASAAKIHPNDTRRIIRALEVYSVTQKPISELQKERRGIWGNYDITFFALNREREELYGRINQRVEYMFEMGIVDEVKKLADRRLSITAQHIIGIEEIKGYLNDDYDLQEAKERMKMNTRRYAKRQLTWFRKDQRIKWLMLTEQDILTDIVCKLVP